MRILKTSLTKVNEETLLWYKLISVTKTKGAITIELHGDGDHSNLRIILELSETETVKNVLLI